MNFSRRQLEAFGEPLGDMTLPRLGGGYVCHGGGKGSTPAAPDYGPLAQASEESAKIGAELGREQLAESQRQYDQNMAIGKPIVDAQTGLMNQQIKQGDDYYKYMVENQRPVEAALNAQSMKDGSEAQQNEYAARAQADTLKGYTQAQNIAARQGMRYGYSPEKLAAQAENQAGAMATSIASAANAGREQSKNLGWAHKMDVAGLYRGLTGASQGSYGLAFNAGNAAMGNQMAPGQALLGGMAQGAQMQQSGQAGKLNGLGNIVSSQTSVYNAGQQNQGGMDIGGTLGGIGGMATGLKAWSSKDFKESKSPVDGDEVVRGLQRIPVEQWKYKKGISDEAEHVGPYAEDVQREFGDDAAPEGKAIDMVSMNGIALAGIKSLANRADRLEKKLGLIRKETTAKTTKGGSHGQTKH